MQSWAIQSGAMLSNLVPMVDQDTTKRHSAVKIVRGSLGIVSTVVAKNETQESVMKCILDS